MKLAQRMILNKSLKELFNTLPLDALDRQVDIMADSIRMITYYGHKAPEATKMLKLMKTVLKSRRNDETAN